MQKYSEVYVLKISKEQKETLTKIKERGFVVSKFVRQAIKEKIQRDHADLKPKPKKEYCPFWKTMTKQERNTTILKFTIHASALLNELDNANVDTDKGIELKKLLEWVIEETYKADLIRSTNFLQTLENRFDTVIRKTSKEFNLKLWK